MCIGILHMSLFESKFAKFQFGIQIFQILFMQMHHTSQILLRFNLKMSLIEATTLYLP